ncbi:hypothetical protein ACTFIZ_002066 [Dictyostelium cf. discoideum]
MRNSFSFYSPGENELIQFEEGFYNTDLSNLEISNMVSDDSSTSSSSSTSHVSSSSGYIPRSIDQTISRVNTNPNSTTLETRDYSTFQSHVKSIFGKHNSGTAELSFHGLSTIKVLPKLFTALLNKTLVLCKMFGLARSSDLVKWSFKGLNITTDSIRGPVINAKEQRKDGVLSILELTSLDDTYSQVCPFRHLTTYLKSTKERTKKHQSDSVFINNDGTPLQVNQINEVILSTLSKSGIDTTKFKSHSTRSAMASLLLSNNVPFHVVKKMDRWKSNDTVDTFYDKRIIGDKFPTPKSTNFVSFDKSLLIVWYLLTK